MDHANFLLHPHFFSGPPRTASRRIYPLFLPFSGCPQRCLFCAQELQTGIQQRRTADALAEAGRDMERIAREHLPPLELAFFGGTFTALPEEDFQDCLHFTRHWQERGIITDARCSTRPDALTPERLARMRAAGISMIELGVQSFHQPALERSGRGYSGETARRACGTVRDAGFALGIQLMPGMPGVDLEDAAQDVETSIALSPGCVRLYPCLVLEGTPLAALWRAGNYMPWETEITVEFLARACRRFESAGVAVIRMGLAEEPGLAAQILAGPHLPDIGGAARSLALYFLVREQVDAWRQKSKSEGRPETTPHLFVPQRCQGFFWGRKGALASRYAALGLSRERVSWWADDRFALAAGEELPEFNFRKGSLFSTPA